MYRDDIDLEDIHRMYGNISPIALTEHVTSVYLHHLDEKYRIGPDALP